MRPCGGIAAALAALTVSLLLASAVSAQTVCTAADVVAQDSGCPNNDGPCSVTKTLQVGNGCTLDFAARALTIAGTLDINSGSVIVAAGNVTVGVAGFIDGRGTQTVAPGNRGGMLTIQTPGDVTIQRGTRTTGRIDVSGNQAAGVIAINAGGSLTVAGRLDANQLARQGNGGVIRIRAKGDLVTTAAGMLSATGGDQSADGGGVIDAVVGGKVAIGGDIDLSGSDGGALDLCAGDILTTQRLKVYATGDGGGGGNVNLTAGTSVQMQNVVNASGAASLSGSGSGSGGVACINAQFGNVVVGNDIIAEGATPDGGGGEIDLAAQGTIAVQAGAVLSVRGNGPDGCGGVMHILPNFSVTTSALLDASGGSGGGEIDVCAGTDATITGGMDISGRNFGGAGGQANLIAGMVGPGALTVQSAVDVTGGACNVAKGCGAGGVTVLNACYVTVAATGSLLARGPRGGRNTLTAREQLVVRGKVDAARTTSTATEGTNTLEFPQRRAPVVTGIVIPTAATNARNTCTAAMPLNCLLPCPTCGNGVVEYPETCDDHVGTAVSCDGCSALCQFEDCNDHRVCTIDSCDPVLGCRNVAAPSPCTEPPTPTPVDTPTPPVTSTPSVTGTATMLPSSTPGPIDTPTLTAVSSATPTPTPPPTAPATTTATERNTPTASRGDVNCDGTVTATDLSELATSIANGAPPPCDGDVNRDGVLDAADINALIRLLFESQRASR